MPAQLQTLGFGGGCHWCTEGVFGAVRGVSNVRQGWIASTAPNDAYSEAILLDFDPEQIGLETLVHIHLHSHSATSSHSMRSKYRSAVYVHNEAQAQASRAAIATAQQEFDAPIVTQVLPFEAFRLNTEEFLNYYQRNPDKPFCQTYIAPKLKALLARYPSAMHG